jgi:deoxyadenosine/deoxycytidine kinase
VACVAFVSGVTGVGKTTVLESLIRDYSVLLERTAENPYLRPLIEGRAKDFDAALNQAWFLDRASSGILGLPNDDLVLCDQAPEIIVGVYSATFFQEGLLSNSDFGRLQKRLQAIQRAVRSRWSSRIDVVHECAPTIAARRLLERDGSAPAAEWIGHCQSMVGGALRAASLEFSVVDTTHLTPAHATLAVRSLVRERYCKME